MTPEEPQGAGGISRRRMLKRVGAGAAVAWTAPILMSVRVPAFAQSPVCRLASHMEGEQEVPPVPTPGTGTFHGERTAPNELHYTYSWQNLLGNAMAAHIHKAPRGMTGPSVVPQSPPSGQSGSVSDTATVDPALLDDICANPGEYYTNVHTDLYPGGEIRGQLQSA
ncbi:MAG: CHRD domain-containing protein [Actinomycetota bacterium]